MTVDMSKQYQTRDGRKVRILCVDAKGDYPVAGLIDLGSHEVSDRWTLDGAMSRNRSDHPQDLIPVPEKRRLTGWVNVYEARTGCIWDSKESAEKEHSPYERRIACVEISQEYTVGEGL